MQTDEMAYVYKIYKSNNIRGSKFLRTYDRYELSSWLEKGKKLIPWERKVITPEGMNIERQNAYEYKDVLTKIKMLKEGTNPTGLLITDEQITIRLEYLDAIKSVYEQLLGPNITSKKKDVLDDCVTLNAVPYTTEFTDFLTGLREIENPTFTTGTGFMNVIWDDREQ